MPADKDAAKRRRQARNRQERQNRQARTEGAKRAAARPSRTVEETPDRSRARSGSKTGSKAAAQAGSKGGATTDLTKRPAPDRPTPGGVLGKLFPPRPQPAEGAEGAEGAATRPARPTRPPSEVIEVDDVPGIRGLLMRLTAQPGGRATILALLTSVVAAVTMLAFPVWPSSDLSAYGELVVTSALEAQGAPDGEIDDAVDRIQTTALEQLRGVEFGPPEVFVVVALSVVPIAIAFIATRSLLRPTRSRTLMWCSFAGVAVILFNRATGLYVLLVVLALGFAAYQSAKADRAAVAASS